MLLASFFFFFLLFVSKVLHYILINRARIYSPIKLVKIARKMWQIRAKKKPRLQLFRVEKFLFLSKERKFAFIARIITSVWPEL